MIPLKPFALFILLLNTSACVFGVVITPEATSPELRRLETAVNHTRLKLKLLDIEQTIPAGKAFRPTVHADGGQPPKLTQLKLLNLKGLATNSNGMALTLHDRKHKKPIHAYLVVFPIHVSKAAPTQYLLTLSAKQGTKARQGKTVMSYGVYTHGDTKYISWVMWLADKSLDVDCGCS